MKHAQLIKHLQASQAMQNILVLSESQSSALVADTVRAIGAKNFQRNVEFDPPDICVYNATFVACIAGAFIYEVNKKPKPGAEAAKEAPEEEEENDEEEDDE